MIGPADNANPPQPPNEGAFSLQLGNNVHLELGRSTVLLRRFQGGGASRATIRNKNQNPNEPTQNIKVSGGTIARSTGGDNVGKHIGFQSARYVAVENVRFEGVKCDWNAEFRNCDDVRVTGVVMHSGVNIGEDGLHFSGGSRIVVSDCNITCGDDALTFVNNSGTDPLEDIVVTNCYLHSKKASALKIEVEKDPVVPPDPPGPPSAPIRRVQISNIVAKSSGFVTPPPPPEPPPVQFGRGIIIQDLSATMPRRVSDIEVSNFWLDASESGGFPLMVAKAERVRLRGVVIRKPHSRSEINSCEDVELCDCIVDTPDPAAAGTQCLWVGATGPCANIRLIGGLYRGATSWGVIFGSNTAPHIHAVTGFEISNVNFTNSSAGAGGSGLLIGNASGGLVIGNRITNNSGWGIQEVSPSNNNIYIANRLIDNNDGPIVLFGPDSEAIRNVTATETFIADTGGFRQTIDGWTINSSADSGTKLARFGIANATGVRFRAARPGSVTGLVVTSTDPRDTGSLKVEVFNNSSGNAGADGDPTGFSAALDSVHPSTHAVVQAKDTAGSTFVAGDELYLVMTKAFWAPLNALISCAIEIED